MNRLNANFSAIDFKILIAVFLLVAIGLVAIYSATAHAPSENLKGNFLRQIWWVCLGMLAMLVAMFTTQQMLAQISYIAYIIGLLLLALVLIFGTGSGASRWITFGPINFQPSEFAKIATLMAVARYFSNLKNNRSNPFRQIAISFSIVAAPAILIVQQPDLGTSLVFLAFIVPILYWADISPFNIFIIVAPVLSLFAAFHLVSFFLMMALVVIVLALSRRSLRVLIFNFILNVGVGIVTPFLWNQLHGYQQKRILTFMGLEADPRGIGYQLLQSKVAIGSGGLWGKGIFQGTQTQLRFLPTQHSDFILSVIGEEAGFIGIIVVLSLFLYVFIHGIQIAAGTRNQYLSLLAVGSVSILAFHTIVNVGMTVGMMPVTGLPLPFLSYGGSFALTCFILAGFIFNASLNKN